MRVVPPARAVLHPLRERSSAQLTRVEHHPHGRRRAVIDHRPLAGVTPAMLLDWFSHIGGTMTYGGETLPRYLAWHPLDHIAWDLAREAPGGGAAEGARFHIVEAFARRPEYLYDGVDRVEKLDVTGIRLVQRIAGVMVVQLEHTWSAGVEGTHYVSVLDVGARAAAFAPINRLLARRLPDDMLEAWIAHNIEEVGHLEQLLPTLHAVHA
ncbi:hypothetical protein [Actinomycetospora flava]|uniref:DAPG hydrolase PhiG domain-containing protein n=1 Tax=Actinomycetospora flava TaxID=3129232 RepID=A0ABU8LY10_9PSEU